MKKINLLSIASVFAFLFFALQGTAFAQGATKDNNFTDEDYEKFVDINVAIIPVQQEMQGKMVKAIEDEGLEINRFQELARAQQSGNIQDASDDPAELAKFNQAGQKVMEMQKDVQVKVQEMIEEEALSVQKFQQISMAYNQDQKVKEKIDALMQEKMNKE
ncbi:DUF4168 domain-containing protein [Echinicola marina]|uniref:DUF4168 domain-containing protein n=1 Tax=Echinicola marina TaxID=2859768 RepID=UPI001CF65066|nr:DUF4168 domain-containing protein [Echinicola marina]UCS94122.1 DUF4168 domain-containing protein [Echinicola marina]